MAAALIQVRLRSGSSERTCWVEDRVKRGDRITLKNDGEPGRWWDVAWTGTGQTTAGQINRGWHNNI